MITVNEFIRLCRVLAMPFPRGDWCTWSDAERECEGQTASSAIAFLARYKAAAAKIGRTERCEILAYHVPNVGDTAA